MLSQPIWWASIALEILLLYRGVHQKLLSRYPVFYSYISFVLFGEVISLVVRDTGSKPYLYTYWITEFAGVALGCGVVFEIYRIGLCAYPGTARMARRLLGVVFVIAVAKGFMDAANEAARRGVEPHWWGRATATDVEAYLRAVEALAIVLLVALFLFYSIPFGKNLRGVLLGYGLFVCWSVVCLPYASGVVDKAHSLWANTSPASFLIALTFWSVYLWAYHPNPVPKRTIHLELEYQRVARATQRRLEDARSYLAKAVGS